MNAGDNLFPHPLYGAHPLPVGAGRIWNNLSAVCWIKPRCLSEIPQLDKVFSAGPGVRSSASEPGDVAHGRRSTSTHCG